MCVGSIPLVLLDTHLNHSLRLSLVNELSQNDAVFAQSVTTCCEFSFSFFPIICQSSQAQTQGAAAAVVEREPATVSKAQARDGALCLPLFPFFSLSVFSVVSPHRQRTRSIALPQALLIIISQRAAH